MWLGCVSSVIFVVLSCQLLIFRKFHKMHLWVLHAFCYSNIARRCSSVSWN